MFRWIIGGVSLALLGGSVGFGQAPVGQTPVGQTLTTEQSIAAKLQQGPFVLLRGMYAGDKLRFDDQGNLTGTTELMPLSLSAIHVDEVRLSGSKVEVKGTREGLEFLPPENPEDALVVTAAPWLQERVSITIARDKRNDQALDAAVDRVFAPGLDDPLAQSAPEYWRPWLHHYLHRDDPAADLRTVIEQRGESCSAEGLRPPRQTTPMADPQFSDAARRAVYGGRVVLHMTVDSNGEPQKIFLVRPLGMGLDENAVEAARRTRFVPATRDGQPVACEVNMQMSFRIRGGYRP